MKNTKDALNQTESLPAGQVSSNLNQTIRCGLLGQAIAYSQSPRIYTKWFQQYAVQATFDIIERDFVDMCVLQELATVYRGICITTPYKSVVFDLLCTEPLSHKVCWDASAKESRAVNVLLFDEEKIVALNSDALAILDVLTTKVQTMGEPRVGGRISTESYQRKDAFAFKEPVNVVVLGAGGAAKASVWALLEAGLEDIYCLTRQGRGQHDITQARQGSAIQMISFFDVERVRQIKPCILVNATPLGSGREGTQGSTKGNVKGNASVTEHIQLPVSDDKCDDDKSKDDKSEWHTLSQQEVQQNSQKLIDLNLVDLNPLELNPVDLKQTLACFEESPPQFVIDWAYNDETTLLEKWAKQHDILFISGAHLLREQAKKAFELWFSIRPIP